MPIMWKCPGQPSCRKIYLYARGLKAHIPGCKHARKKEVRRKRAEMETLLTIMTFVEDQQKGNVTVSRRGVPSYSPVRPVFTRLPSEARMTKYSQIGRGAYPLLGYIE